MTKYQKAELTKLLREAVFARDGHKCLKCGRTDTLAPAHIYPKGTHQKMRWDTRNVITLCFQHHMHWAHKDPNNFVEWLHETLPKSRLQAIKMRSQVNDRSTQDFNLIKLDLINEKNQYEKITNTKTS